MGLRALVNRSLAPAPSHLESDPPPSAVRPLRSHVSALDVARPHAALRPEPLRHPSVLMHSLVFSGENAAPRETTLAALVRLGRAGATGLFVVGRPGVSTRIYLVGGRVVFSDDDTMGRSFAEALVASGLTTRETYGCAIAHMPRKLFECEQMRLAEVLVELGVLRGEDAHAALEAHVGEQVAACLASGDDAWTFDPVPGGFKGLARFPRTVEQALLAAGRAASLDFAARALAIEEDRRPRVADLQADLATAFGLTSAEAGFVARLDGVRSVVSVLETAPVEVDPRGLLVALVLSGHVVLDPPAPA